MVPVLVQAHTNLLWRDEEPGVNSSREKQENIQEACPRRRSDAGFRWSMPIYITNYWAWIGINSSIPALNERYNGKNPSPSCLGVYLLFILIAKPMLTKNPSYLINSIRKKTKWPPRPLLNKDFGKQTWLWINQNLFNPFYKKMIQKSQFNKYCRNYIKKYSLINIAEIINIII